MNIRETIGRWFGQQQTQQQTQQLREQSRVNALNYQMLRERLLELEMELAGEGWIQMIQAGEREFSRAGLRTIMQVARLMFLKNPLIRRATCLQAIYVWAQGVTVSSEDPAVQEAIDGFMSDPANQAELTSHQARTLKEIDLQTYGNLFFVLFTGVDGVVRIRTIPPEEVEEIICDPEDAKSPWFYKRTWSQDRVDLATGNIKTETRTAYYPDLRYPESGSKPATIGRYEVLWSAPVYHVKAGGLSDMKFGLPEYYAAQDWARAYNEFLSNWATIVRAYAQFAWDVETKGGPKAVAALQAQFQANDAGGVGIDRNPPAQTASMFISSNTKMQPMRTAGATTAAEDGMYLALMVAAAVGLPYPILMGDPSTGNLATAKTLDRPTELKFRDRQELWKGILKTLIEYSIARSRSGAAGRLGATVGDDHKSPITVDFPPILEHDVSESLRAIISGATLDGKTTAGTIPDDQLTRMILTTLGVQNVDEVLATLAAERAAEEEQGEQEQIQQPVAAAVESLREAIAQFAAHAAGQQQQK